MNKSKLIATVIVITLLGIAMLGLRHTDKLNDQIKFKQIELQDNSAKLKLLDTKYLELNKELETKDVDKAKVEEQLKQLQIERDKLQADLQAKKEQKARDIAVRAQQAAQATVVPQKAAAVSGNFYKDFIYQHESGNRTTAVNSIGCRGLGQACPGTKLPCGDDYACQDAWFTNYAMTRYGSWEKAYNFWLNNHWW